MPSTGRRCALPNRLIGTPFSYALRLRQVGSDGLKPLLVAGRSSYRFTVLRPEAPLRPQQKPSAQVDPPQPQEAVQEPDPAELQQQCKDARAAAIKQLAAVGGEAESRARATAAELERAAAAPEGRNSFAPEAASTEPKPQMSPQTEGGASDGRAPTEADVPAQPDASFSTVLQQTSIATVEAEQAEQRLSMRSGDGVDESNWIGLGFDLRKRVSSI